MSRKILPASNETAFASGSSPTLLPTSTQWNPPKGRRKVTGAACQYCRLRKRGCNGKRPCLTCTTNKQDCVYEVAEAETNGQALKRKYAQMVQDRDELKEQIKQDRNELQELLSLVRTETPQRSLEVYERLREGQDNRLILKCMQYADILVQTSISAEQNAKQMLLSNLMQTTASFDELVNFIGDSMPDISDLKIPDAARFRELRGQKIDLTTLRKFMGWPLPQRRIAISDLLNDSTESSSDSSLMKRSDSLTLLESQPREPPFKVPAHPWTTITKDDDFVSHLVSVYLEWMNPGWRQVEEDLFLEAMRSGDAKSEYCSPLLVNSMLALASLNSERGGVFIYPDDYMTRGQHFHDEALKQRDVEKENPTVASLCGLCVLFVDCVVRGKDKVGVETMALIDQLENNIPRTLVSRDRSRTPSEKEIAAYRRARRIVSWAALLCDMATANTILKPAYRASYPDDLMAISELPPSTPIWTAYPTQHPPEYLDRNALWLEFCKLGQLTWRAQHLLFSSDRGDPYFHQHVEALTREMIHWKRSLPQCFQYRPTLPGPVFDLYSYYNSILMALYSLFAPLINGEASSPPTLPESNHGKPPIDPSYMREQSFACARDMSSIMADYRQTYGLKTIVPYMIQANGLACFTLLQDLGNPASQAAFKEAFRCLLGAGMQLLWARGMARMLHLTAQNLKIVMPPTIVTMLKAVADTAWTKSDKEMLSSCWPNYVVAKEAKCGESVTMDDLIKKWERLDVNSDGTG